jgi:hypothetical protein
MKRYKEPDFQERIAAATSARDGVLARLRAKPPIDEADLAARVARQAVTDAAAQEKQAAARLAANERKAAKRAKAAEKAAQATASPVPELSEAERKAARDARYLARKNRSAS